MSNQDFTHRPTAGVHPLIARAQAADVAALRDLVIELIREDGSKAARIAELERRDREREAQLHALKAHQADRDRAQDDRLAAAVNEAKAKAGQGGTLVGAGASAFITFAWNLIRNALEK